MDIIRSALFGVTRHQRGSRATFVASAIILLVAFTGLAVDTARGYLMKAQLNYALDGAAQAGGRVFSVPTARDATINKFFRANFPDGYMGSTVDGPHIITDDAASPMTPPKRSRSTPRRITSKARPIITTTRTETSGARSRAASISGSRA